MVDTGIDFHHQSGNSDERPFPAANGSGVAAFDYDLDGHADLFYANGTKFPVDLGNRQHVDALYRNRSQWQFQKVSAVSGVDYSGYSAGVTVGDYNHDGFPDLYVTCYGENRLYENQGDGSFLERAELAGVNDSNWGTSAVWFDLNNDGLLDLYVGNYGIWSLETNKFCHGHRQDIRIFCSPTSVDPAPDCLFLNRGDGTRDDISAASQVTRRMSRTQGVLAADLNGDGWVDLYLGNDMHSNSLFLNRQDGTFADETDVSGVGYSSDGKTQAGMGVAVADSFFWSFAASARRANVVEIVCKSSCSLPFLPLPHMVSILSLWPVIVSTSVLVSSYEVCFQHHRPAAVAPATFAVCLQRAVLREPYVMGSNRLVLEVLCVDP
jgi:hypothetical protein